MINNIDDLINELKAQDFEYFLNKMLDDLPDDIDKREGSLVYDAIAPCAMVQAERSMDMINYLKQSHIETATGEFLDYFANDKGTAREQATAAKVTASVLDENKNIVTSVAVGDVYASVGADSLMYTVIQKNGDGTYLLQANDKGKNGNMYTGQILPVTPNDSVNIATITDISVPARDEESDEDLRQRLTSPNGYISYAGNVADYVDMITRKAPDVGAVQVYPAWHGGGSVKLVIVGNDFKPASAALINETKEIIDPDGLTGQGYGLAPIGHQVTVTAPALLDVTVTVKVVSDNKVNKDALNEDIKRNIEMYFSVLKKSWAKSNNNHYSLTIYRSQIMAIVLQTNHVVNAELPQLNGNAADINLTFNSEKSELPNLKEVVIND